MADTKIPLGNPLRALQLDELVLSDPLQLAEAAAKQIEALGIPSDSPEVKTLTYVLDLVTKKRPDSQLGELSVAEETLEGWVRDYRGLLGVNAETLRPEYDRLFGEVSALRGINLEENRLKGTLFEMLTGQREEIDTLKQEKHDSLSARLRRTFFPFVPNYFKHGILREISENMDRHFSTARHAATKNVDEYDTIKEQLRKAREIASDNGINFERTYSTEIDQVIEGYISHRLRLALHQSGSLAKSTFGSEDEFFIIYVDAAQTAAAEFKREAKYRNRIKEVATAFVAAAVRRAQGAKSGTPDYNLRDESHFLAIARTMASKYNVPIPTAR